MGVIDENRIANLLREAKENGQNDLLKRILALVNRLLGEQRSTSPEADIIKNGDSRGKDKDSESQEEGLPTRATRAFLQLDNVPGGPCGHCGTLTSSAWRDGPVGKEQLCNQCGARYVQKGTLHGFFPTQRGGLKSAAIADDSNGDKKLRKVGADFEPIDASGAGGSRNSPALANNLAEGGKEDFYQDADDSQKPHRPKAMKGGVEESSLNIVPEKKGDSPGSKRAASHAYTPASNNRTFEWMKILEQLENKPSLGGSIRELRELLIQAIYAAKEEESACSMQIPERLQGTLDMVTNRSVIQARRMALNLLEEARINTAQCSQCGAQRLTRHKVVDPKSFRCGVKECLYPKRECGTRPDSPHEWYFQSDIDTKLKRGHDMGMGNKKLADTSNINRIGHMSASKSPNNGIGPMGGAMYNHAGPQRDSSHSMGPSGSGWQQGYPDRDAYMNRMGNTTGFKRHPDDGRDRVESLEAAFAGDARTSQDPQSAWYVGQDMHDMNQGGDGKRFRPTSPRSGGVNKPDRMRASTLLAISCPNGRGGGHNGMGPFHGGSNTDGPYPRPEESDEMVSDQWRHHQGAGSGGRRSLIRSMHGGGPGIGGPPYPYPEGGPMTAVGNYEARPPYGPPGGGYGYGSYGNGNAWPGMMPQQGFMENPDYHRGGPGQFHDTRNGYDRGMQQGLPGNERNGIPHSNGSRGGGHPIPGPYGAETAMAGSPTERPGSPSSGPVVLWRAEVQPPDSKDSRSKVLLFKVKSLVPSWLFPKLPPVLVVKGFTPRNNLDISSVSTKPLMMELDELVDQQRLDLNMMIVDRVAIMCELPEFHLALVPHRNQYASLHVLGMVLPKNAENDS